MDNLQSEQPTNQPVRQVRGLPEIREVVSVLAREYSFEVLRELHHRGWSGASEIARELGIHVATAMRKLAELETLGFLEKRNRSASRVVEYRLASPRIEILVDFDEQARAVSQDAWAKAEKILVKERPNRNVVAETDEKGKRVRRLVFTTRGRWRAAGRVLELTDLEGGFLWHVPFGSDEARPVAYVCRQAGIEGAVDVARILEFLEEMERLEIVEVVR